MKRLLIGIIMLVMVTGCAGLNVNVAANVATDTAFVLVLQNNPTYKVPVIEGLQRVKTFLSQPVTYDALILEISKAFGGKYAYAGIILRSYIDADKPIFESNLTLFEAYKNGVLKKIDTLLILANI